MVPSLLSLYDQMSSFYCFESLDQHLTKLSTILIITWEKEDKLLFVESFQRVGPSRITGGYTLFGKSEILSRLSFGVVVLE